MKKLAVLLFLAAIAFAQAPDIQRDPIGRLRFDAKKYGIHWEITCNPSIDADSPYFGRAWNRKQAPRGFWIEDEGSYPHWFVVGKTQEDAALKLWSALQERPNAIPEHNPSLYPSPATKKAMRECKAPIGSEIPPTAKCEKCEKENR